MQKFIKWLRKPILRCTALLASLILTAASAGTSYAKYTQTTNVGTVNFSLQPKYVSAPTLSAKEDLVFYLNGMMKDGYTWTDLSGNGNHAEIYDNTDWINALPSTEGGTRFAKFKETFARTTPFTLETTITLKYNEYYHDDIDYERELIGNLQGGGYGISLIWDYSANAPKAVAYMGDDSSDSYARAQSSQSLVVGNTYTLAMTFDGTSIYIWVDGVSTGSAKIEGTANDPVSSKVHLGICCDPEVTEQGETSFRPYGPNCDVYTARLYDRALTDTELKANTSYDRQFTYSTRGLEGYVSTDYEYRLIPNDPGLEFGRRVKDSNEKAYLFYGSSDHTYITLAYNEAEQHYYSGGMTMECMFSADSLSNSTRILACNYGDKKGYGLELYGDTLYFYLCDTYSWDTYISVSGIQPNVTYVATATYTRVAGKSEGKMTLHLNGVQVANSPKNNVGDYRSNMTNEYFLIGANPAWGTGSYNIDASQNFVGKVYSFALYSRPLSANEIATNYNYLRKNKYDDGLTCGGVTFTATDTNNPAQTLQLSTNNSSWSNGSSKRYTSPAQYTLYARAVSSRGVASSSVPATVDTHRSSVTKAMIGVR